MLAKAAVIAVVVPGLLIAPPIGVAQAPQTAGSRIGTIIRDAIEVALPNTTELIDASLRSDGPSGKDRRQGCLGYPGRLGAAGCQCEAARPLGYRNGTECRRPVSGTDGSRLSKSRALAIATRRSNRNSRRGWAQKRLG